MRKFAPGLLLLGLLWGCSPLQNFRVVDAQTGQPVDGVQIERLHAGLQPSAMPFVLLKTLDPVEKKTTDASGSAAFQEGRRARDVQSGVEEPGLWPRLRHRDVVGCKSPVSR